MDQQCLKEKHKAFRENWVNLKLANRNIKNKALRARLKYKDKVGYEFANMNTKQAFQKVQILTGCELKATTCAITDPALFVRELNAFYGHFDNQDFSECKKCLRALPPPDPDEPSPFTVEDMRCQLSRYKLGKAPGPDCILLRVLKNCAQELSSIFHSLSLKFTSQPYPTSIPYIWKMATIIPAPKKPRPTELTSIIMKCLEKLLLNIILPAVNPQVDLLHFAYKGHRGCCSLSAAPPSSASGLSSPFCQDSFRGPQLCF